MPGIVTANHAPAPPKRFGCREGGKYQRESASICVNLRASAVDQLNAAFSIKTASAFQARNPESRDLTPQQLSSESRDLTLDLTPQLSSRNLRR